MSGTTRNALSFESLERKQMLAGDVLVSLVDGNLVIEGDVEANQIAISSGDAAGTFIIQARGDTEVRMAGADPSDPPAPATGLVVEGVRGHVRVSMGEGDDEVIVHDAQFRHGLSIGTGAGMDTVRVGMPEDAVTDGASTLEAADANVVVRGSLLIRTDSENDVVGVGSAQIGGALGISTDGGDDTVNVGAAADAGAAAALGDGDPATLHARLGVDILLGDGTDAATLRDVSTRAQVLLGGGAGGDTIGLHDVSTGLLGIRGGDGDAIDRVALSGVKAGHAGIELGGGADVASIVDSAFSSLAVALGSGNDSLSIQTVKATRALLGGGEGDGDELTDAGDNTIKHLAIAGFELPLDVNIDLPLARSGRLGNLGGPAAGLLGKLRR